MDGNLLATALEQADRSSPGVRAAALMRIARVQLAVAPAEARATFERGLEAARQLASPEREMVFEQASYAAAAVAPHLLSQLPSRHGRSLGAMTGNLCKIMIEHGRAADAVSLVLDHPPDAEFPFYAVPTLMHHASDEATKLALLRRAIAAWRLSPPGADMFLWTFQSQWKVLPEEEAREVTREMVHAILEGPEMNSDGTYDREGTVRITSGRENMLFQILGPLRHLDPALAETLIAGRQQLAAAARRFPNGLESVMEESRQRAATEGATCGGGFIMGGDPRDFPYMRSLMQAELDGEFGRPLAYALERYQEDTAPDNPNQAPIDCWPSTAEFRSILHRAGKRLGAEAARLLDEIPDTDIRLLAEIELAAALAGLPELQGVQMFRPKRPAMRRRTFAGPIREVEPATPTVVEDAPGGPSGPPRIRCPKCNWTPSAEDRWQCHCKHVWNTFDTGGVCPSCLYQWKITMCPKCGQWSAHSDWYTQG
jgi:hypothetical protein